MTAAESPPSGPYAAAAETYWRSGWRGVLPLPPGQKAPVPNGWTGRDGAWPSYPDVQAWIEDRAGGNVGLRLPPGVLGVDVDQYGSKPGYLVLQSLEQQLGALPATWRSTSRDDGMSGIRLYRIPEGLRWPGVLGPGIETIRYEHRYAVAWPSVHPNGGTYRWITPEGATALESVPAIDDLPRLPDAWVEHFTRGELATDQARADLTDGAVGQWVAERGTGAVCRHMASALASAQGDLTTASSRHDATLQATNRLTWLAGEGHTGGTEALTQLRAAFLKATAPQATPRPSGTAWSPGPSAWPPPHTRPSPPTRARTPSPASSRRSSHLRLPDRPRQPPHPLRRAQRPPPCRRHRLSRPRPSTQSSRLGLL